MINWTAGTWRKSTYSGTGNACVEVAPARRKSPRSGAMNNCVEAATASGMTAVRDSKNPDGAELGFRARDWKAFVSGAEVGTFDGS